MTGNTIQLLSERTSSTARKIRRRSVLDARGCNSMLRMMRSRVAWREPCPRHFLPWLDTRYRRHNGILHQRRRFGGWACNQPVHVPSMENRNKIVQESFWRERGFPYSPSAAARTRQVLVRLESSKGGRVYSYPADKVMMETRCSVAMPSRAVGGEGCHRAVERKRRPRWPAPHP